MLQHGSCRLQCQGATVGLWLTRDFAHPEGHVECGAGGIRAGGGGGGGGRADSSSRPEPSLSGDPVARGGPGTEAGGRPEQALSPLQPFQASHFMWRAECMAWVQQ